MLIRKWAILKSQRLQAEFSKVREILLLPPTNLTGTSQVTPTLPNVAVPVIK